MFQVASPLHSATQVIRTLESNKTLLQKGKV